MGATTVDKLISKLREENDNLQRENNALKTDIVYWKSRHQDAVIREETLKGQLQDR